MKTMAVVTMAFLPGTWAAAFCEHPRSFCRLSQDCLLMSDAVAMPLFDWSSAPGDSVLNERFWLYWAVTLPMTIAVLSAWWLWKEWRQRKDAALDKASLLKKPSTGLGGELRTVCSD